MGPRHSVETFAKMTGDSPFGSGIGVRPTTPADTAEICDLLEQGFGIAANGWRPLCTTNWLADYPRGFVLTDGGRIVGHLATIYAQREINGKTGIVCNHSSLAPAPVTQRVLEAMGFAILERRMLLFPPGRNAETRWRPRVHIDVNEQTVR